MALGRAIYDVEGLSWRGPLDAFWREAPAPDPGLAADFLRAVVGCLQVRGVYYARPGLDAAVAATVRRLHEGTVGEPADPEGGWPGILPVPESPALVAVGLRA
jgi:capsular polysaccharide export protein